ncbi:uncharacterized protein LOC115443431 [Manduca sexta]|uniref:uncharacterized protein LOC115443431 n=1 Tax=Manduca sexta TaxID=7130 RepID=UPI0018901C57|nr:uncharacterized protein LOC115443431 [Manduca sexta]
MHQEYDSSSSNDVGYNIKKYNRSSNRWIECNDIKAEDFDIITSRISHASEKITTRKQQWYIVLKNITASYISVVNFLKRGKEKETYRKLFHRHKRRNEFFVYGVGDAGRTKQLVAEREWFKREYSRQVGEPKPEDENVLMKKATDGLIRKSKCIPFERICYAPPLRHVSELEQVSWKDTPLAITCTCPAELCKCPDRKNSILPPAKIPYKRRPTFFGIKPFCWAIRFMKYPKPAGTLIPKLVEAAKKEAEYYSSPQGRKELNAKGPEFCMSGCLQYLVSSMAVDAALAAEIAKMQAKVDVGGLGMLLEEDVGESVSAEVCDEFSCTVATQTENDPETGELMMGDYSAVLYGSIDDSVMNDVEGMKLQISTYSHEPPDPCAFSINKVLHVEEIKQHISKIKEMYSTMSAARESYCCNDVSCQFRGLSFIESLGSMLGKCKCKSVSSKEQDMEKDKKVEEAAGDAIPEEPEFVCPPILERIVELKGEVNDFFKKYFKRVDTPHPCRKKLSINVIDKDVKQEPGRHTEQETIHKAIEKNVKPETTLGQLAENTIGNTAFEESKKEIIEQADLKEIDIIKETALEVINKNIKKDALLKATERIQETASKVKNKKALLETTLKDVDKDIRKDIELKVKDNNVVKYVALDYIDENIEQNNRRFEDLASSDLTKEVNISKKIQNEKLLKSCSCLEKAAVRNELHYHKAVECCVDKNGKNKKAISSHLDHMTFATDRNKDKGSDKNVVKSQPHSGDKLSSTKIKNTEEDIIKEIHKSSVINFVKDIKSSSSKSSSVKSKRSSISKLKKPPSSYSRSRSNSEEFNSSGVLTMISRKVSNSGWRGWFSFMTEKDKDTNAGDNAKSKSSMRTLGKEESKEEPIKKHDKFVKSISENHSYYTDEVVQNVESLRHLSSSQITGSDSNKYDIKGQETEPVMPKHYRFYY